jgi:hypothetical protein
VKDITSLLNQLKSNQEEYKKYNKDQTKQAIVSYAIELLGWDTHNLNEVSFDYSISGKKSKRSIEAVDYSLQIKGDNKIFIQVEKGGNMDRIEKSFVESAMKKKADIAVLTDGLTWNFYVPGVSDNWKDVEFLILDVAKGDSKKNIAEIQKFISKENTISGKGLENATKLHAVRKDNIEIKKSLDRWLELIKDNDEKDLLLKNMLSELIEKVAGKKPSTETIRNLLKKEESQS